jgi:hypothetical protein
MHKCGTWFVLWFALVKIFLAIQQIFQIAMKKAFRWYSSMINRGSRFLNYNFLQFAVDGKNNSKSKVEKAFFFIFMSSYAEMHFLKQKITK